MSHRWAAGILCLVLGITAFCGIPQRLERRSRVLRRADSDRTDYWSLLGVEPGASVKEVKRVFRQRAKKEHPDVNKSPDALQRWRTISDAYGKLIDPAYRRQWEQSHAQASSFSSRSQRPRSSQASSSRAGPSPQDFNDFGNFGSDASFGKRRDWAAASVDAFRDLLRRAERLSKSSLGSFSVPNVRRGFDDVLRGRASRGSSMAAREARAAELELQQVRDKVARLRTDAALCLELSDKFRQTGQKQKELEAGKRTLNAHGKYDKLMFLQLPLVPSLVQGYVKVQSA